MKFSKLYCAELVMVAFCFAFFDGFLDWDSNCIGVSLVRTAIAVLLSRNSGRTFPHTHSVHLSAWSVFLLPFASSYHC